MAHEAVSSLIATMVYVLVAAHRWGDTRPHACPIVFGAVQLFLELQLLLLKVCQGAFAFPVLSLDFFCLYFVEVLGILLSGLLAGLSKIEVPPLQLLKSGLVL